MNATTGTAATAARTGIAGIVGTTPDARGASRPVAPRLHRGAPVGSAPLTA
jgi:hypothetical protein